MEFLLAIEVVFTFWSQVGGQGHLDLMFWPWKFFLSLLVSGLIVSITAHLCGPRRSLRRMAALISLLLAMILVAGAVTYYYHLNEPADDEPDDSDQPALTRL